MHTFEVAIDCTQVQLILCGKIFLILYSSWSFFESQFPWVFAAYLQNFLYTTFMKRFHCLTDGIVSFLQSMLSIYLLVSRSSKKTRKIRLLLNVYQVGAACRVYFTFCFSLAELIHCELCYFLTFPYSSRED